MEWIFHVLTWYLYVFALGIVFQPLTAKIFSNTLDKGYAFSKALGLLITTYFFMLFGIFRIIPYGRWQIISLLTLIGYIQYRKIFVSGFSLSEFIKKHYTAIKWGLLIEMLFIISLITWSIVRGQEPNIRGLEKFMDYGFMQSIGRTTYMPPLDMWYSADIDTRPKGYFINYYYFGHMSGSLLTKLSDTPSEVGYNLVLANLFALGVTMSFSIVVSMLSNISRFVHKGKSVISAKKLALFGALGVVLVNFAGNWHLIYLFTKGYENEKPVPPWTVLPDLGTMFKIIATKFPNFLGALGEYSKYWYPNATRFIESTIHEFPSYSYVVADLHGHVFDIPFVMLSLAFIFFVILPLVIVKWGSFISAKSHSKESSSTSYENENQATSIVSKIFGNGAVSQVVANLWPTHAYIPLTLGLMTAIFYMTNAFDGPIYLLLFILVLFALYKFSAKFVTSMLILGVAFIVFTIPFSAFFEPFVSGVGVNCGFPLVAHLAKSASESSVKLGPFLFEKGNCQVSPIYQLIILWGLFWIFGIFLVIVNYITRRYMRLISDTNDSENRRLSLIDVFILGIFGFGTMLLLIPEFFYIKDIYPTHFRANTMFKMGYQAYIIMSLMIPYVVWRIGLIPKIYKWSKLVISILSVASIILVTPYMFYSVQSYYGDMTRPVKLDGIAWLKNEMPEVHEIINFFNTRVAGQPVILEAQGDSYTDYNVVSSYTGLPTVAGWWVHEWLWRGSADIVGQRIPLVEIIYRSDDIDEVRKNLRKFNVRYVIVSSLERKKYEVGEFKIKEAKFKKLGREIFRSGDGKGIVYEIN